MKVVAIAAVADNGVIGSGQEMLWHISEDGPHIGLWASYL